MKEYELIDSGDGRKLERFGPYVLSRPCSQAVWSPQCSKEVWEKADAFFTREEKGEWNVSTKVPERWEITIDGIVMKIQRTDFGHVGIFPEQQMCWHRLKELTKASHRVLNLFAYSGGSTLFCAQNGAKVCHVDASNGMVQWAKENAARNGFSHIRWIVEDAIKFLKREVRRGSRYDAIILDPPSFGRGSKGEVFKIERDIQQLLFLCKECLEKEAAYLLFSCHTPGFTPTTLSHLLEDIFSDGEIEKGEMVLKTQVAPYSPLGDGCGKHATSRCSSTRLKTLPSSQHLYPGSLAHPLKGNRTQLRFTGSREVPSGCYALWRR